ncbi:MAG: YceI family protein [Sulfuricella sp.]|nr:YceI family protein [Sulfuricella sp.]
MAVHRLRICALALAALLLAGCAPAPPLPVAAPSVPAGFPDAFYREAAARGEPVFSIDGARSLALIHVYRGGSLGAKFGHDHLVSSRGVRGHILLPNDLAAARVDLYLSLDTLAVDDPERLAAERMPAKLSAASIEATRRNMLGAVLDAARYPFAVIHATCGNPGCTGLSAQVTLHGVTRRLNIPLELERKSRRLVASGHFELRQTDFGITPYSALGGALLVRDRLDLSFCIEAANG